MCKTILLLVVVFIIFMYGYVYCLESPAMKARVPMASKHFYYSEFACKCCGTVVLDEKLIACLEKLRELVDEPILVTSGYRCEKHNKEVGGVNDSQHMYGKAVDIKIKNYTPAMVAVMARECGFTWVKVYSSWTHVDVR